MKIRNSYKYRKLKTLQEGKKDNQEDKACKELIEISNYETFEETNHQLHSFVNSSLNSYHQTNLNKLHTSDVSFNRDNKTHSKFPMVDRKVKNKIEGKQVFVGQSMKKAHSLHPTQYVVVDSRIKHQSKMKTNNL